MTGRIDRALSQWASLLGTDNLEVRRDAVASYEQSTFEHVAHVHAVVRPGTAEQVQDVVRIAAECGVALYPVSAGKNWGYGSRTPVRGPAVIVDLGRLNRILHYDPELAFVTVEPGVTQGQLVDFLAEQGGHHWADTTSVTPRASVLGNAIERGHGLTPFADHVDQLAGVEVVLGCGDVLRTGHGRFDGAKSVPLDRYGVGPALQGLFTQSNFGIVTQASVWLMPAPAAARAFVLDLADDEELFKLVPALRQLRLQGTVQSGPRFANVFRGLMFHEYPWDLVNTGEVLCKADALRLATERGQGAWRVCFAIYGPEHEMDARTRTVEQALDGVPTRSQVFDPRGESGPLAVLSSLLTGQLMPGGAASVRTYWRKRARPQGEPDPDRDGCGVMWLAPVSPFRATDLAAVSALVEEVLPKHGFEPDVSAYCLRARALHYHISIIYDRDDSGADVRARRAHDELLARCIDSGYPPHRLGVQSMSAMQQSQRPHAAVLRGIKRLLDPAGILSPGRYEPS